MALPRVRSADPPEYLYCPRNAAPCRFEKALYGKGGDSRLSTAGARTLTPRGKSAAPSLPSVPQSPHGSARVTACSSSHHAELPKFAVPRAPPALHASVVRPARLHDRLRVGSARGRQHRNQLDSALAAPRPGREEPIRWSSMKVTFTELVAATNGSSIPSLAVAIAQVRSQGGTHWPEYAHAMSRLEILQSLEEQLREAKSSSNLSTLSTVLARARGQHVDASSPLSARPWPLVEEVQMRLDSLRKLQSELISVSQGASLRQLANAIRSAEVLGVSDWHEVHAARIKEDALQKQFVQLCKASERESFQELDAQIASLRALGVTDDTDVPLGPALHAASHRANTMRIRHQEARQTAEIRPLRWPGSALELDMPVDCCTPEGDRPQAPQCQVASLPTDAKLPSTAVPQSPLRDDESSSSVHTVRLSSSLSMTSSAVDDILLQVTSAMEAETETDALKPVVECPSLAETPASCTSVQIVRSSSPSSLTSSTVGNLLLQASLPTDAKLPSTAVPQSPFRDHESSPSVHTVRASSNLSVTSSAFSDILMQVNSAMEAETDSLEPVVVCPSLAETPAPCTSVQIVRRSSPVSVASSAVGNLLIQASSTHGLDPFRDESDGDVDVAPLSEEAQLVDLEVFSEISKRVVAQVSDALGI